jgi:hypothetical protein
MFFWKGINLSLSSNFQDNLFEKKNKNKKQKNKKINHHTDEQEYINNTTR